MPSIRVFISHSPADHEFVDVLARALRGAGANVWYDDRFLTTGQLLGDNTREMESRPVFIIVLSRAAFASEWVRQEWRWAYNLYRREPGRTMLPVVASAIAPDDFGALPNLEEFKRLEAPGFRPYPQAEAIERTLDELMPAQAAAPPTATQTTGSLDELLARGKMLVGSSQFAA